ncbi:hypothetical protein [Flaviaesturariibacter amylovorans]|uniref:Uncharacterized protein n=1 Tax=Flaviaesturariibacter amylovorans TaxID=1084520 RepID=A0ABP8HPM7_9BACT
MRRLLASCLASFLAFAATAQDSTYVLKEIGWTLRVPAGFKPESVAQQEADGREGAALIKESTGLTLDDSEMKTLLSVARDEYNSFNVTIRPFDSTTEGPYPQATAEMKPLLYKTLRDQVPDVRIDSSTTQVLVGGLPFDRYAVVVHMTEGKKMHMVVYSRLHLGYDMGITYLTLEEAARQKIEAALRTSKFTAVPARPKAVLNNKPAQR